MLFSIALMLGVGMFLGWVCSKLHLPNLLGMIITGILLGPFVFNLIDPSILNISSELRRVALIIILTRAGLSLDDVFVIVVFSAFAGIAQGDQISAVKFINIPISIAVGAAIGLFVGYVLAVYFEKVHIRDSAKVIIVLCISFVMVTIEDRYSNMIPFASLIAIMCVGIALQSKRQAVAKRLSLKFNKLWVAAEIILFVLVGATVDIHYAVSAGAGAVLLIVCVLAFRMAGVFVCLLKTKLSMKERIFCMIAYTPKATVQAAIGGIPLAMGLACGNMVLTVAVLSILITAPIGAFLIDLTYRKLLVKAG